MIFSGLLLGLLGSLHCVGMCGPIAFLLPLDHQSPAKKLAQIFLYHFGRLLTYGALGVLFGWFGKGLFVADMQQRLSIAIGILMILAVLIPMKFLQRSKISQWSFSWMSRAKTALGKQLKKNRTSALFSIGLLNGLLPCGMVYMGLFGALAFASPLQSGLYMLLFGVGTIPLMTTAAYLGNFLSVSMRQKITKAIPVAVVVIGLLFILRGMGLGIPYISPSNLQLFIKADPNCIVP